MRKRTPQTEVCATFCFARKFAGIGYEIHAAARKGMAARDAAQGEPRTAPRSMNSQRVGRVMRAGGIEFAGARHHRRKKSLIYANGKEQRARREAHVFGPMFRPVFWMERSRRTSSASSGANAACATVLRG